MATLYAGTVARSKTEEKKYDRPRKCPRQLRALVPIIVSLHPIEGKTADDVVRAFQNLSDPDFWRTLSRKQREEVSGWLRFNNYEDFTEGS